MGLIGAAVQIGQDAYWDGLFSDNPPVEELIRTRSVGVENIPDEIWLIKLSMAALYCVFSKRRAFWMAIAVIVYNHLT